MVSFLLAGTALGLSAGFAPGPLLAMVISHTVRYGLTEGMKLATAPLITDLPIVAGITYLGNRPESSHSYSYRFTRLGMFS